MTDVTGTGGRVEEDCRPDVERIVADLPGQDLLPRKEGELAFSAPWEIRAFALAVAAHRDGRFSWPEFQGRLVAAIDRWERADPAERASWSYYREWLQGLESLLLERGLVDADELDARTHEFLHGVRDPKHH
ncbi:nitrile hydratase accessory protein [Geodermatophilus ruber]|uniref:nitrile hydratase accessory protein n=1 Tax=Geodermatophilus ruber TaxID=504800 RepID=UPI0015A64C44|nr:nitrile hydratase accessory protein [Geodermatophilus ruber]